MMRKSVILVVTFFSAATFGSGSGSLVGNGAGLVENSFQYAYSTLSTLVRNCLEVQDCSMTDGETRILRSMQLVLASNSGHPDRLVFISEKDNPGFFDTAPGQRHRIAKTGLTSQSQIFINVDAIYSEEGKPLLDFPAMVSILAHEVGHQSGEVNHALLDILGTKLRQALEQKMVRHEMNLENKSEPVDVMIINHSLPLRSAEILLTWPDVGTRAVTGDLVPHLKCSQQGSLLSGFEFKNGHFIVLETSSASQLDLGFSFWAYLSCYSTADRSIEIEKAELRFGIDDSLQFRFLERIRIP